MRLADLCEIRSGGTPLRSNPEFFGGDIPWAKIGDMETSDGVLTHTEEHISESGLRAIRGNLIPPGTLLLAIYGSVGKIAVTGVPLVTNQAILSLRIRPDAESKVENRYLYWWLATLQARLNEMARGVTQSNLTGEQVKGLVLPKLPPLAEQRRIADLLDQADALRRKRRAALGLLDELLRSTFVEMFGDPVTNPKGWPVLPLGKLLLSGPSNGLYLPASDYGSGTRIIRIDSFSGGRLGAQSDLRRVRADEVTITRFQVKAGDILVNRVNSIEHLGKAISVPALEEATLFESNMMRMSLDTSVVLPVFVGAQLGMGRVRRQIRNAAKDAVNQSSINQGDVSGFEMLVPPVDRQQAYNQFVEDLEVIEVQGKAAAEATDALFQSLLHRAFQGQL